MIRSFLMKIPSVFWHNKDQFEGDAIQMYLSLPLLLPNVN